MNKGKTTAGKTTATTDTTKPKSAQEKIDAINATEAKKAKEAAEKEAKDKSLNKDKTTLPKWKVKTIGFTDAADSKKKDEADGPAGVSASVFNPAFSTEGLIDDYINGKRQEDDDIIGIDSLPPTSDDDSDDDVEEPTAST